MMKIMPKVIFSKSFEKDLRKLIRKNYRLKNSVEKLFKQIRLDINHPSLRLHKIPPSYWSVTVESNLRIIFLWKKDVFYLIKIGNHDKVYK